MTKKKEDEKEEYEAVAEEAKVEPKEDKKKELSELEKCEEKMAAITKEYGQFSDIPLSSEYWELRKEAQKLRSKS